MITMQIIDYIQPEIISHIPNKYISEESDYYTIWEKQRGDQFWSNLGFLGCQSWNISIN